MGLDDFRQVRSVDDDPREGFLGSSDMLYWAGKEERPCELFSFGTKLSKCHCVQCDSGLTLLTCLAVPCGAPDSVRNERCFHRKKYAHLKSVGDLVRV